MTVPVGIQLAGMAQDVPARVAVRLVTPDGTETTLTTRDLDAASNRCARWLLAQGAGPGTRVASTLGNSLEHYVVAFGAWKAGSCFVPLNARAPERELTDLVDLVDPVVLVGDSPELGTHSSAPLDPVVCDPGLALATGGSTGRPKLIVTPGPWGELPWDFLSGIGLRHGMTQLISGPVHHNGPFVMGHYGLLLGHALVVLERFDASLALDQIERHRVQAAFLVPTTMRRLLDEWRNRAGDLSSLEAVVHSSAPCPPWLKQAWIELVGAEHVFEAYGSSEGVGGAHVRGDTWLERPGTVGRPYSEVRITGPDGALLGPDEIGEIYLRRYADGRRTYEYVGAPSAPATPDGFVTVGDMGWLDSDGYLFLADRRHDLIITGGINVYPAEVEAALSEHPDVLDVAVIGVADDEWGARVHAIVQPRGSTPPQRADLIDHCKARLAGYKVPKTFDFVESLPRTDAGKLRRSAL
jgi:bile acid-coenzyme A ligase